MSTDDTQPPTPSDLAHCTRAYLVRLRGPLSRAEGREKAISSHLRLLNLHLDAHPDAPYFPDVEIEVTPLEGEALTLHPGPVSHESGFTSDPLPGQPRIGTGVPVSTGGPVRADDALAGDWLTELLSALVSVRIFALRCALEEYTDTGGAWEHLTQMDAALSKALRILSVARPGALTPAIRAVEGLEQLLRCPDLLEEEMGVSLDDPLPEPDADAPREVWDLHNLLTYLRAHLAPRPSDAP